LKQRLLSASSSQRVEHWNDVSSPLEVVWLLPEPLRIGTKSHWSPLHQKTAFQPEDVRKMSDALKK
jgi:hypothetical protein